MRSGRKRRARRDHRHRRRRCVVHADRSGPTDDDVAGRVCTNTRRSARPERGLGSPRASGTADPGLDDSTRQRRDEHLRSRGDADCWSLADASVGTVLGRERATRGGDCDLHARRVRPGERGEATAVRGDCDGSRGGRRWRVAGHRPGASRNLCGVDGAAAEPGRDSTRARDRDAKVGDRACIERPLKGLAGALQVSPFHADDSIVLPSIQNTVGTPLTIAACGELQGRSTAAPAHRPDSRYRSRRRRFHQSRPRSQAAYPGPLQNLVPSPRHPTVTLLAEPHELPAAVRTFVSILRCPPRRPSGSTSCRAR